MTDSQVPKNTFQKEKDPSFLVAKGRFDGDSPGESNNREREHRGKLANAIIMSITKHGYATVRAVGTKAIANAVRSLTTATRECKKKGIRVYWDSSIDKGNLGSLRDPSHVQDVTAYVFKLQHFEVENDSQAKA